MCGICGFVSKREIKREIFEKMNDSMVRRGPDDRGVEMFCLSNEYNIGLAQRRLSILDLSTQGHQPMPSYDHDIIIVFNGEIYNFLDLRNEISDYPYKSRSDTEVIIASYLKWGRKDVNEWVKKLDGMFAIALFDRKLQILYLIRDRMGKKPLYFWHDADEFVFASELKPIMLYPYFERVINKDIIPRFLFQQYINAPDTIFKSVYQLEPGRILSLKKGQVNIQKYWDVYEEYKKGIQQSILDYSEAKSILKGLLKEAIKKRIVADVPVGTLLSGGYDSSIVTALAQECSNVPIDTFSIGVYDNKLDEAKYAREISKYLGTNHTEMYLDDEVLLEMVQSIPQYFDQPFADSSQIPTMLVSKLAKKKVTVALSGDGGDELFCGYSSYDNALLAQKYDKIGMFLHLVGKIKIKDHYINEQYPIRVRTVSDNSDRRFKAQVGAEQYVDAINRMMLPGIEYGEQKYEEETKYNLNNWQIKRMLLDMDTYLPGDILTKVDRASMAYSLETRCPILDTNIVSYSFRIPHSFKYAHGDKKHILKDVAYDYIPKQLLERPKQGFSIPINKWLLRDLRCKVEEYANEKFLREQEIFEPRYVNQLVNRYLNVGDKGLATGDNFSRIVWPFFVFQQWYEHYML